MSEYLKEYNFFHNFNCVFDEEMGSRTVRNVILLQFGEAGGEVTWCAVPESDDKRIMVAEPFGKQMVMACLEDRNRDIAIETPTHDRRALHAYKTDEAVEALFDTACELFLNKGTHVLLTPASQRGVYCIVEKEAFKGQLTGQKGQKCLEYTEGYTGKAVKLKISRCAAEALTNS